ncbi:class I SAM-dependent methyltransferase [Candidatus Woesearchaeota archaeon]|nr:class I SAM-dependent methyltransferase [Candidatus Woesearchaeota archaeon]
MKLTKNLTISQIKNRRFLKKEARKMRGIILDLGCGDGEYSEILAQNPHNHIIALDANKNLCQRIPHKNNLKVVHSDAHNLPFKNNSFDAVFCNTVLEHVKEPNQIIKEIKRVLKPQGKLLISIPFLQEIHSDPDDYQRYTPEGLRNLLNKHKIQTIRQHCDYGALNTIEYLLLGSIVWRLRLPFKKNFPEGYLYVLYLALLLSVTKISHILFYPLQKRDQHFLTQVTCIGIKK